MGKLEDIPKKQFFQVPENYFDKLPAQIQSRVAVSRTDRRIRPVFRYALQYALPLLVVAVILFYNYASGPDVESILASMETADLINYLHESGVTTEDLVENIDFNPAELEAIENEVYDLELGDVENENLDLELNTF